MSKIVVNYNGGASDEYATFKGLNEAFSGQVFKGLDVVPNGSANMTVRVNPGSGRIPTGTAPADYYYMISHDTTAGESVTIATASASPRIDYVVAYVDKSVTAVQSPVNNTNNVLKFVAVAGTPASSPVVPTTAQIQSAVGAANPYIILAQVAVPASTTQITAPNIADLRQFVTTSAGVAVKTITNSGNAGGTIFYINLGGLKLLWGTSSQQNNTGGANTKIAVVVNFPAGFLTAVQSATATASGPYANTDGIYANVGTVTKDSMPVNLFTTVGANGYMSFNWFAIGL
ncbi:hypothetical protein [Curtobacterium sp. MCSS17_007]|uniref:hypothetical protein n=1 Tax=Curtobacterium sp. MCSS17_007 TaxID=2175646 RepID=UPI0011B71BE9|nr:hypothetical protein [Curtobacterium sp. MCSS17_007]WIE74475.1 hypothetical protein DEJ22_009285 [Curtobacterium sp. MCSS17_007]